MTIFVDGRPVEAMTKRDLLIALAPLNEDLDLPVFVSGAGAFAEVSKSIRANRPSIIIEGMEKP